jgi:phage terminase large subunit
VNGTEFIFKGLKHNATEIKSTEGVDICWVEEAEKVTDNSWEVLIPTIRKEGSEIWISFNPKNPTDPTYVRFVANADDDMLVKKVSWRDNPYFPDVLDVERQRLEKLDPVAYKHIWEGEFDERYHGAVYAEILKKAQEADRIGKVPHKVGVPVITAWDLGKRDATSIWFAQKVGLEVRVIDFYEATNEQLGHYADVIREKPYSYEAHYLPHDGRHERLGMAGSIKDQLRDMGLSCRTLPNMTLKAGIELARQLLSEAWIDAEACKEGLHALRNYHYAYNENKGRFEDKPEHDWSSHASDAMRYLAMALDKNTAKPKPSPQTAPRYNYSGSWMS